MTTYYFNDEYTAFNTTEDDVFVNAVALEDFDAAITHIEQKNMELMQQGLRPLPDGYKIVDGCLVEKTMQDKLADGEITMDALRGDKLARMKAAFDATNTHTGYCTSSLGFVVDATRTSLLDVQGLVKVLAATGQDTALFRDYHNQYHQLGPQNLQTIELEIITYGQWCYGRKWELEQAIAAADSVEDLDAIRISFVKDN